MNSWPKPLASAAFHGPAGRFVLLVEPHSEADPAALLVEFLVGVGSLIGRGPHFAVEGDEHSTNLFALLIGRTSRGRKGTSWRRVRRFLQRVAEPWARECIKYGLSSGEGLIWAVRDPIAGSEAQDPGAVDKRCLVVEEEFCSVLRVLERHGNTLGAQMRCAWDTGDLQVLTKNSPVRATGAHVSIIGHITQDELRRELDRTEMANGFLNRFLLVCVGKSKCLADGGRLTDADFNPLAAEVHGVLEFARTAREIRFDEEARALWRRVYPLLSSEVPGLLGAVIGRAEAQVIRLSVLFAVLDGSKIIRREHLLAALAVWDYCERSARFVFGETIGDPIADEILRGLRATPDGLDREEIRDLLGRHARADRVALALKLIEEHGLATFEMERTGGRAAERWKAATKATEGGHSSLSALRLWPPEVEPVETGARHRSPTDGWSKA